MKLSKINQPSTLSQTYNVSFLEANRVPKPILLSENGTRSSQEHPADASTTQSSLLHQSWCSDLSSSHQTLPAQVYPHRRTAGTSPIQHAAFVEEQGGRRLLTHHQDRAAACEQRKGTSQTGANS